MKKIKPFESPFAYLTRKIPFLSKISECYYKVNKFDAADNAEGVDPRGTGILPYLLGGFNPLINMRKDFIDTFKPYKSGSYFILRDLIQPFRGIGNMFRGVFNVITSPILLLINTLRYAVYAIIEKSFDSFLNNMKLNLAKSGGGFLNRYKPGYVLLHPIRNTVQIN